MSCPHCVESSGLCRDCEAYLYPETVEEQLMSDPVNTRRFTTALERIYIVDIDGTLANLSHRLHFIQQEPKQWDSFFAACENDTPIQDVIDVVRQLDSRIIYLTGRPERVRRETTAWLNRFFLPPGEVIMRKDGDHRPDTTAKKELMERIIAEGGRIVGVFEDRPSVCRVWREMGLTVFQMQHTEF